MRQSPVRDPSYRTAPKIGQGREHEGGDDRDIVELIGEHRIDEAAQGKQYGGHENHAHG